MTPDRFNAIAAQYPTLRIAMVGDFCLDRYFEIDPHKKEISIETGLPVHNVTRVRCQPGGAGTILNNLVALGIGRIDAVGFCGDDGEGWELRRALAARARVSLDHFTSTPERHTFSYSKPLVIEPGKAPVELNRLDIKNWTVTPASLTRQLVDSVRSLASQVDAIILLDQVDLTDTGVVTGPMLEAIDAVQHQHPSLKIIADSRRSLADFPKVIFKMNSAELARMSDETVTRDLGAIRRQASALAARQGQPVFVTMAERGIVGAAPDGQSYHVPAMPVRGEIDVVGAGDTVTANLIASLVAGASLVEAMELAMAAASVVVHQLGTTGTASVDQIAGLL